MKYVVVSVTGVALLLGAWACSSFDTATAPGSDGGTIVADGGIVSETGTTVDGNATVVEADGSAFVVPLGDGGCASVTSSFCVDFENSTSLQQDWVENIQTGTVAITEGDGAPSPSHYVEFTLTDDEAAAFGHCAYDRLILSRAVTFKRLTAQFDVLLASIDSETQSEAINFAVLDFHTTGNKLGETLYLGVTGSQIFVHEQFDTENRNYPPSLLNVSRTSWVSMKETLDLTAHSFTLEIKGQPEKTVSFTLGGAALDSGVTDFDFGIGYSCAGRGGDIDFDDVVITYE